MEPPVYSLRNCFNTTVKHKRKYIGNLPLRCPSELPSKRCSELVISQIIRAAKALVLSEPMAIFYPRDGKL